MYYTGTSMHTVFVERTIESTREFSHFPRYVSTLLRWTMYEQFHASVQRSKSYRKIIVAQISPDTLFRCIDTLDLDREYGRVFPFPSLRFHAAPINNVRAILRGRPTLEIEWKSRGDTNFNGNEFSRAGTGIPLSVSVELVWETLYRNVHVDIVAREIYYFTFHSSADSDFVRSGDRQRTVNRFLENYKLCVHCREVRKNNDSCTRRCVSVAFRTRGP